MSCESLNENFNIRIVRESPFSRLMSYAYKIVQWRMTTVDCTVLYEWDGVNVCTIKYQKLNKESSIMPPDNLATGSTCCLHEIAMFNQQNILYYVLYNVYCTLFLCFYIWWRKKTEIWNLLILISVVTFFSYVGQFCPPGSGSGSSRLKSTRIRICNTVWMYSSTYLVAKEPVRSEWNKMMVSSRSQMKTRSTCPQMSSCLFSF